MARLDMQSLKLLVIDDDMFMRQLIIRTLKEIGIVDAIPVNDGYEGLEKVEVYGGGIDVIICDLEMPKLDGFGFVMKLRALADPNKSAIPVIILTGNSEVDNLRMAIRLGISAFIVKPISKKNLEEKVHQALLQPMINKDSMEDGSEETG